jgi:hypothetical protein
MWSSYLSYPIPDLLVSQRNTLPTRYFRQNIRGDSFHQRTMRRFLIPWIAENHAVLIQAVHVPFGSFIFHLSAMQNKTINNNTNKQFK